MCVLSIKVPIRKKSGNLFNDPRTRADLLVRHSRPLWKWTRVELRTQTNRPEEKKINDDAEGFTTER